MARGARSPACASPSANPVGVRSTSKEVLVLRPELAMTKSRRSRLGVGALMIGIPASAAAIVAGQALASPVPEPHQIQPQSRHIAYGHDVIVRGSALAADAGHTVALEYAQRGATVWSQLGSTTVGTGGAFRLSASLEHSGLVRVLDTTSGSLTPFAASSTGDGGAATNSPVPVYVAAGVRVRRH